MRWLFRRPIAFLAFLIVCITVASNIVDSVGLWQQLRLHWEDMKDIFFAVEQYFTGHRLVFDAIVIFIAISIIYFSRFHWSPLKIAFHGRRSPYYEEFHGFEGFTHRYRVKVTNRLLWHAISGVSVKIIDMQSQPNALYCNPVLLKFSNDSDNTITPKMSLIFNGRHSEFIDVISLCDRPDQTDPMPLKIEHIMGQQRGIMTRPYSLVMEASGVDIPSARREFAIWVQDGKLMMTSLSRFRFLKRLRSFHRRWFSESAG